MTRIEPSRDPGLLSAMTTYVRSKICGLTSQGDALAAAEYGADAVGLVFYSGSPRCVEVPAARTIARAVGPFVTVVGLFVDADADFVRDVLKAVPLHVLQFHGSESPDYCEQFHRPYIKALRVKPVVQDQPELGLEEIRQTILRQAREYKSAQGILLDTFSQRAHGGTGESFDWQCVPKADGIQWILAGGLNPGNVRKAVQIARPYGVDVSSGVEFSPGAKDPEKVRQFIDNTRAATEISCG